LVQGRSPLQLLPIFKLTNMRKLIRKVGKFIYSFIMTFMTFSMDNHTPKRQAMKHAKFSYQITTQGSRQCIVVTDTRDRSDRLTKSVVEDMDCVLSAIELAEHIRAKHFIVVFTDYGNTWDGFSAMRNKFLLLGCGSWPEAVAKYIREEFQPQHA
jgi:hypothetical protein